MSPPTSTASRTTESRPFCIDFGAMCSASTKSRRALSWKRSGTRRACGPPLSADQREALLPGKQGVVNVDIAGTNGDGALHPPRRHACIRKAALAVERLRRDVVFADLEPEPIEPVPSGILFRYRRQRRRDTPAPVLRAHLHILQLRRIRERQVRMPERLLVLPRHQVEAVALVQPRQPKERPNPLDLIISQSPNGKTFTRF